MNTEIVKKENIIPALTVGPFIVTRTGLILNSEPTWAEWQAFMAGIEKVHSCTQWVIGDACCLIETQYGDEGAQLLDAFPEYEYSTLNKIRWVSSRIENILRRTNLSWSHHETVAALKPKDQRRWLNEAAKKGWDVREFKRQMKISNPPSIHNNGKVEIIEDDLLNALPTMNREFNLVIADPPYNVTGWHWDHVEDYLSTAIDWLKIIKTKLNNHHHLFWFCSPKYLADFELIFRELDLPIQSRVVWHRRNMSMGSVAKSQFIDTWEMILHTGNHDLNFPDEWSSQWFDVQIHAVPQSNFKDMKTHPTQKPLELIRRLVRFGSLEDDNILDPFAGSGTTGHACILEGRYCVLIERDQEYVQIIRKRLNAKR